MFNLFKKNTRKTASYKLPTERLESIIITTLLTEKEFKSTFTAKMIDITQNEEPIIDIWPYVEQLVVDQVVDRHVFDKTWVEKVYRNQTNTFDQILLPTTDKNIFVIIVVDIMNRHIKGHYKLNLNTEYGLI
jgi:hypothetical protein